MFTRRQHVRCVAVVLACCCWVQMRCDLLKDDAEFYNFYNTLSKYIHQPTDLIFVIDESGSVGAPNFVKEILFTEMVARMFRLASTETRVAVTTFSTGAIVAFDDLNSDAGNLCNFLERLRQVPYRPGWTHTRVALETAGNLFSNARRTVHKVIVLISDGQSNQGDPIPVARDLRQRGIVIFAVGVGDIVRAEVAQIVRAELSRIASSEQHLYLVTNFDRIQDFNANLRKDVQTNDLVVAVAARYCQATTPCRANAVCACQRTGGYTCACQAGHHYHQPTAECRACPAGTYQSSFGQHECVKCPLNTNTTGTGATSLSACQCDKGFHGSVDRGGCLSIKCPKLPNVPYGRTEPLSCDNVVYSKCAFWCSDLYCPYDGSVPNCVELSKKVTGERVCQPNGRWSGEDFRCDYVKCPKPDDPDHGRYHCDPDDRRFKSSCSLKCDKGYKPVGEQLKCLRNSTWSGTKGRCEVIHCKPLKPRIKVVMKPEQCRGDAPLPYQTRCQLGCTDGYEFVRRPDSTNVVNVPVGHRVCTVKEFANSTASVQPLWHGSGEKFVCKDAVPPVIKCPPSIEDRNKPSSKMSEPLTWDYPTATDNVVSDTYPKVSPAPEQRLKSKRVPKSPSAFPIGDHKLVYVATDMAQLTASCSFKITIKDVESPVVIFCPSDKEQRNKQAIKIPVHWGEPRFKDNSGEPVEIFHRSHSAKDEFAPGPPRRVVYKARDRAGNEANCTFFVKMKPYTCPYRRPPVNGFVTCVSVGKDEACTASCDSGHAPVKKGKQFYVCEVDKDDGRWKGTPSNDEHPWPDCGAVTAANATSATVHLQYRGSACKNEAHVQALLTQQLKKLLMRANGTESELSKLCSDPGKCKLRAVHLDCDRRKKREATAADDARWSVRFEFEVSGNLEQGETATNASIDLNAILNRELPHILNRLDLENLTTSNDEETFRLVASETPTVSVRVICGRGQQVLRNGCVNCPPGSFFDASSSTCDSCPAETYQPDERATSCLFCSPGTTNLKKGSVSEDDCLKPCGPGTSSATGLGQCLACGVGFFQPSPMQRACRPCPEGTTTWMEGAIEETDCQAPCVPGTVSPTGLAPCLPCPRGSFQAFPEMTRCIPCPGNLTTTEEGRVSDSSCSDVNFCDPHPCHNGTCVADHEGNIDCICDEGFGGEYCDADADDCEKGFCFNNGACVDGVNNFWCLCSAGFTGERCETNIDDCFDGACANGGTCTDGIDAYRCVCPDGVAGERCEVVLKNCDSHPCQNGGRCFDSNKGFRCCCPAGFAGRVCEVEVDECAVGPCMHGGSCTDETDGYRCACPSGYEGADCELNVNDCDPDPCANGAACIDEIDGFTCVCPPGFSGSSCETERSLDVDLLFPTPSDVSYVKIPYDADLAAVTVSFWMQAWPSNQLRGTPFSFAYLCPVTAQPVANALTWYDFSKFIIHVQDETFQTTLSGTGDREWHHYAMTWDSADGKWAAYRDGELAASGAGTKVGQPLWRGTIVLGQDQDIVGGGFTAMESFHGKLSQFNVWDFAMNATRIKRLTQACGFVGNVFDWSRIGDFLVGNVQPQPTELCVANKALEKCQSECFCQGLDRIDALLCERGLSTCTPSPCQNNGTCQLLNQHPICRCTNGTTGRYCQHDINECAFDNGNCSHSCSNTVGAFTCGCPDGFYLHDDRRTCVTTSRCTHAERIYLEGEKWEQNCTVCSCTGGRARCHPKPCSATALCDQNGILALVPGDCCPRCVKIDSTCTIRAANQYRTFDGAQFTFTSFCQYVLAQDCSSGTFSISIENDHKNVKKKNLVVAIYCSVVEITSNGNVRVNGKVSKFPHTEDDFTMVKTGAPSSRNEVGTSKSKFFQLSITTKEEVIITWNSLHEVSVQVPKAYEGRLCGLCGNFNQFPLDDFQTRSYLPAESLTDFALSWRAERNDSCAEPSYRNPLTPMKVDPRKKCPEKMSQLGSNASLDELCQPLRMQPFTSCYQYVNIREYYELCLVDACMCQNGSLCHCSAILTYVQRCNKHRIIIADWKGQQACENYCTGGQIFDECAPPCPKTCARKEEQDQRCNFRGCRIGCRCPSSLVLHEGRCIAPSLCPPGAP